MTFTNSFMNCECIKIYTIINKIIVFKVCKSLQIESYSLFKLKSLRDFDKQLIKRFIIHYLLSILNVHDCKKRFISYVKISIKSSYMSVCE